MLFVCLNDTFFVLKCRFLHLNVILVTKLKGLVLWLSIKLEGVKCGWNLSWKIVDFISYSQLKCLAWTSSIGLHLSPPISLMVTYLIGWQMARRHFLKKEMLLNLFLYLIYLSVWFLWMKSSDPHSNLVGSFYK